MKLALTMCMSRARACCAAANVTAPVFQALRDTPIDRSRYRRLCAAGRLRSLPSAHSPLIDRHREIRPPSAAVS
jgi:hypothetical protein